MKTGALLDINYETEEGRAVVKILLRGKDGFTLAKDRNFLPYIYVALDDKRAVKNAVETISRDESVLKIRPQNKGLFGERREVLKVILRHPQEVPRFRERAHRMGFEVFEHDILFVRRYLLDHELTPLSLVECKGMEREGYIEVDEIRKLGGEVPRLMVLAFDIEVYNPKGAPRADKDPIIMISMASNTGLRRLLTWKRPLHLPEYVEVLKDEAAILNRFAELVSENDYDLIMGYNSDNFDFPYLDARLKRLGMHLPLGRDGSGIEIRGRKNLPEARVFGRCHIDIYPIIRRSIKLNSYVLEDVARDVLGLHKAKIPNTELWKYWDRGGAKLEELVEYSMGDAEIALKLGEEFIPLYLELTKLVKQPLHDVARMTSGQLVEWLLMSKASRGNELIPNRVGGEEYAIRAKESYIGGYVREPKKGLSENIAVFDFRSLYPSIIVTHNIDPSTFIPNGGENRVPGLNYSFRKDKEGFIPNILKDLIERRGAVKEKMKEESDAAKRRALDVQQRALKLLANSFYGYMGYPRARWYKKECAESVAAFARMYIKRVMDIAEKDFGLEVVYGDTDSLFVVLPEEKRRIAWEFLEKVNKALPGVLELEYEGFYKRGIFVTKKRYALIDENNKIVVKGLEFVRRDWAPIAKKTQQDVLTVLLRDASPEKAVRVVKGVIDDIRERRVTMEDITIYTQMTKGISSYKNIEPHVIAAKKLAKSGAEVTPGMIIGYIITKGSKMISQRATPVKLATIEDYDPEYYVENQILPAVLRIFEAMGYSRDYFKDGRKQESITKWF
jgi:DNA polymerase I